MRNNLERLGADMSNQDVTVPQQLEESNDVKAAPLSFIVPTEFVSLPSKGLFYPQNHPLYGKDSIEIKQMTAKEEDILSSRNLLKKGVALDKLIQSLVVDKRINTDTLTIEDRNAIIVTARISAYGADYLTTVACPSCGEKSKHTFNLLEKVDAAEQLQPVSVDENGLFTVTLPATKWNVKCRALNGYDEKAIMRLTEAKKNSSEGDSLLLEQLKMTVISINNVNDKTMISDALNALPARDAKYLRSTYQNTIKGVDMRHTFNCKSCDTQTELEVPLSADFFWFK
jgi:hypothetical protein